MLMRLTNHEMVAHDPTLLLLRSAIALELVPGPAPNKRDISLITRGGIYTARIRCPRICPLPGRIPIFQSQILAAQKNHCQHVPDSGRPRVSIHPLPVWSIQ